MAVTVRGRSARSASARRAGGQRQQRGRAVAISARHALVVARMTSGGRGDQTAGLPDVPVDVPVAVAIAELHRLGPFAFG